MNAHFLVKKTAIGMAQVVFEEVMHDNTIYANWKALCPELSPGLSRKLFIKALYPRLLEGARHTLAQMLEGNYPERLKEDIKDALIKDNLFRDARNKVLAEKLN